MDTSYPTIHPSDHPPHPTTSKSNNKQSIQTQGGTQATTWMDGSHLNNLTLCNMGGWTPAIQQQATKSSHPTAVFTNPRSHTGNDMDGRQPGDGISSQGSIHPSIRQQQQATTSINADLPKAPCRQRHVWTAARGRRSRPMEASRAPLRQSAARALNNDYQEGEIQLTVDFKQKQHGH